VSVATAAVVRSLGLESRPPYPKGHVLEDGDWSLLDPVRARLPMWRRAQPPRRLQEEKLHARQHDDPNPPRSDP
jgi:hypothetical protein